MDSECRDLLDIGTTRYQIANPEDPMDLAKLTGQTQRFNDTLATLKETGFGESETVSATISIRDLLYTSAHDANFKGRQSSRAGLTLFKDWSDEPTFPNTCIPRARTG